MDARSIRAPAAIVAVSSVLCAVLAIPTTAVGWGPINTHPGIVSTAFTDPTLYNLAREFLSESELNSIRNYQGDLFGVHHNEYSAFTSRLWTQSNWWSDVDEITKLQYLGHNCGDSTVPVDHYPANTVFQNGTAQTSLEAQVETNGGYAHSLGDATWSYNISFSYTGTYNEIMGKHYDAVRANASWYKNAWNNAFWPWEYTDANHTAGWTGVNQGSKFARVVFTDYFLSRKPTVAVAGRNTDSVNPGDSVNFSSAGSYDPDSITWVSNGTYYNNGANVSFLWTVGSYTTTAANPTIGYDTLLAQLGPSETGRSVSLRVTDDEGQYTTTTTTVKIFTPPVALGKAQYGWLGKPGDVPSEWDWDNLIDNGSSDPDGGSIQTWAWDLNNDGNYEKQGGSSTRVYYSDFVAAGVTANENHKVTLRVTDNEGATHVQSNIAMPVLVKPVAVINGPYGIDPGGTVQLSAAGSYDPDGGSITQYQWDLTGDGSYDVSGVSPSASYAYLTGTLGLAPSESGHTIRLNVTDNDASITGWWAGTADATTLLKIYANPVCQPMERYAAAPGQSITFSATGSDPDGGNITQWLWELTGDGQYNDYSGTGSLTYDALRAKGLATGQWLSIGLKVVDNEGKAGYNTALLALYPSFLGDANLDGVTDTADYTLWADNYGLQCGWTKGDFNLDGVVDTADYTLWADNYGAGGAGEFFFMLSGGGFSPVPEPSSLALVTVLAVFLVMGRRKIG